MNNMLEPAQETYDSMSKPAEDAAERTVQEPAQDQEKEAIQKPNQVQDRITSPDPPSYTA